MIGSRGGFWRGGMGVRDEPFETLAEVRGVLVWILCDDHPELAEGSGDIGS